MTAKTESYRLTWPRPGLSLVPETYREVWFDEGVPIPVLDKAGLSPHTTMGQLDAAIWNHGNTLGLKILANHVLALITARLYFQGEPSVASLAILGGRWSAELDPKTLPWATRTRNVLSSSGKILDTEWLANATAIDFFTMRHAGPLTLIDFATVAEAYGATKASPGTSENRDHESISQLQGRFDRLCHKFPLKNIGSSDPRLIHFQFPAGWLYDNVVFLVNRAVASGDSKELSQAQTTLIDLERTLSTLAQVPLDVALVDLLKHVISPKYVNVIAKRLGWDGQGGCTLEAAGELVGVTREYVRQLEKRVRRLPASAYLPNLDRAIEILESAATELHPDAGELLFHSKVTTSNFMPVGIIAAAAQFQRPIGFEISSDGKSVQLPGEKQLSPFRNALRTLTSVNYVASTLEFQARIQDAGGGEVSAATAQTFLDRYSSTIWLDAEREWFWYRQKGERNRYVNAIRKILSVCGSTSADTLRSGVLRHHRSRGSSLPRHVFAALCRASGFAVDARQIVSSPHPLQIEEELSEIEQAIAHVLQQNEGVMSNRDLRSALISAGINRHTVTMYVSYAPIIERLAPGVYALRGVSIDPARVAAVIGADRPATKSLQDHGWTSDGGIWLGYRATSNLLDSGVASIPTAVHRLIGDDKFEALAVDGTSVGTVTVRRGTAWGLGPFINRRGVEEGDIVILTIDTGLSVAVLQSGSEELLEDYSDGSGWGPRRILESVTTPSDL